MAINITYTAEGNFLVTVDGTTLVAHDGATRVLDQGQMDEPWKSAEKSQAPSPSPAGYAYVTTKRKTENPGKEAWTVKLTNTVGLNLIEFKKTLERIPPVVTAGGNKGKPNADKKKAGGTRSKTTVVTIRQWAGLRADPLKFNGGKKYRTIDHKQKSMPESMEVSDMLDTWMRGLDEYEKSLADDETRLTVSPEEAVPAGSSAEDQAQVKTELEANLEKYLEESLVYRMNTAADAVRVEGWLKKEVADGGALFELTHGMAESEEPPEDYQFIRDGNDVRLVLPISEKLRRVFFPELEASDFYRALSDQLSHGCTSMDTEEATLSAGGERDSTASDEPPASGIARTTVSEDNWCELGWNETFSSNIRANVRNRKLSVVREKEAARSASEHKAAMKAAEKDYELSLLALGPSKWKMQKTMDHQKELKRISIDQTHDTALRFNDAVHHTIPKQALNELSLERWDANDVKKLRKLALADGFTNNQLDYLVPTCGEIDPKKLALLLQNLSFNLTTGPKPEKRFCDPKNNFETWLNRKGTEDQFSPFSTLLVEPAGLRKASPFFRDVKQLLDFLEKEQQAKKGMTVGLWKAFAGAGSPVKYEQVGRLTQEEASEEVNPFPFPVSGGGQDITSTAAASNSSPNGAPPRPE